MTTHKPSSPIREDFPGHHTRSRHSCATHVAESAFSAEFGRYLKSEPVPVQVLVVVFANFILRGVVVVVPVGIHGW